MINFRAGILALALTGFGLSLVARAAPSMDHPGQVADDSALVTAVNSHRRADYVEAGNLVATKVLPDDTKGLPHQKWEARLSTGDVITIIYNLDLGARVPIQEGESFGVGGQFIPTGKTGIIHWLHDDPRKNRPDGYVY